MAQTQSTERARSKGHIAFTADGQTEYFDQAGQVFRAPVANAFDVDGYRHGRWESSRAHFDRNCGRLGLAVAS